jgi:hypothetical protein
MKLKENDLFILVFGLLLLVIFFLKFPISPFRPESLIVVFLFLLVTRSQITEIKFFPYLIISITGLLLSMFLSPYGLLIYFVISLILYKKTNLL